MKEQERTDSLEWVDHKCKQTGLLDSCQMHKSAQKKEG